MNLKGKGGNFEKPEPGPFAAVCVRVIDLGTQKASWQGKEKMSHKILVSWEVDQKMKDGRPFMLSKQYTVSLMETANLRADLESWRGRPFTQEEIDTFTEKNILGKPCLLTLVPSKDGKYINIGNVTGLPKGMTSPGQVNPSTSLSLDPEEFDQAVFDSLGDTIKAKIMLSPEWKVLKGDNGEHMQDDGSAQEPPEVCF
jgi:hypothetical protein